MDISSAVNCTLCLDLTTLFKCKLMSSDVSPAQIAEGKDEKGGAHVHNCRALTVNATT